MIKVLMFMRRKPGLTAEEFRDLYEKNHPPFAQEMVKRGFTPPVLDYRRHYLKLDDPLTSKEAAAFDFDCVTSAVYESREQLEQMVADMYNGSEVAKLSEQDFAKWMDFSSWRIVVVEECVGDGTGSGPSLAQ